ncbi:MAG: hypothetical protein GC164_01595 [Phycisphaera sp.]|nr:hypothetical protein [Phycisphaera sp.]
MKSRLDIMALVVCVGLVVVCPVTLVLADAQPTLDELLDIAPKPDAVEQPKPDAVPIDPSVKRLLNGQEAADAFAQVIREMDDVSKRLGDDKDAGLDTQRMQEAIVRKLEQIIESASQSSSSSSGRGGSGSQGQQATGGDQGGSQGGQQPGGGSSSGQSQAQGQAQGQAQAQSQPGQASDSDPNSTAGTTPPQADGARSLESSAQEWGNLPPRVRDELLQGRSERFSPLYRNMTEAYYERLAKEQAQP